MREVFIRKFFSVEEHCMVLEEGVNNTEVDPRCIMLVSVVEDK